MKLLTAMFAVCLALALAPSSLSQQGRRLYPLKVLSATGLKVGNANLKPWLMDSGSKREEGMMFLRASDLRPNDAMLFVFPTPQRMRFWNQNVSFSLDIAFIDASGAVVAVDVLKAMDETPKGTDRLCLYVLEMKQGAFRRIGLKKGLKLSIPAAIRGY